MTSKGQHESWADDYQRIYFGTVREEMAAKQSQYDEFFRQVERGDHDDLITDLFVNDLDYSVLVEHLGNIQNASKEETPAAYEALGRYIDRKIGTSIEDKINDTEPSYDY